MADSLPRHADVIAAGGLDAEIGGVVAISPAANSLRPAAFAGAGVVTLLAFVQ